jgi:hypothetical protein
MNRDESLLALFILGDWWLIATKAPMLRGVLVWDMSGVDGRGEPVGQRT